MSQLVMRSGAVIPLWPVDVSQLTIEDVAWSLSQTVRYRGAGRIAGINVAEHSVLVSRLCDPKHALVGLLHDAHEALIGDIPAPLKDLPVLAALELYERQLQWFVLQHFGCSGVVPQNVHDADVWALRQEIKSYLPRADDADVWGLDANQYDGPDLPHPRTSHQAYLYFLERYRELTA